MDFYHPDTASKSTLWFTVNTFGYLCTYTIDNYPLTLQWFTAFSKQQECYQLCFILTYFPLVEPVSDATTNWLIDFICKWICAKHNQLILGWRCAATWIDCTSVHWYMLLQNAITKLDVLYVAGSGRHCRIYSRVPLSRSTIYHDIQCNLIDQNTKFIIEGNELKCLKNCSNFFAASICWGGWGWGWGVTPLPCIINRTVGSLFGGC